MRTALAILLLVLVSGCPAKEKKTLDPVYSQGGVVRGQEVGGDSLRFTPATSPGDPDMIGTAGFSKTTTVYTVRRSGPKKYELLKDGKHAGMIDQDKNWITVTIDGEDPVSLRSDEPGFLL